MGGRRQAAAGPRRRAAAPSTGARTSSPRARAGGKAMAAFEPLVPTMVGGAADLSRVDEDRVPRRRRRALHARRTAGRNVFFGVREHGMGGAVNGMAAHGGIVRPYGSTFLQFADYMRGSIRLCALMGLRRRVGLHARLGRARRGRPDPPAGRAPRRAARDPRARRAAPRRRQRDRRGVARDPRGARGPGGAGAHRARTCRCSTRRTASRASAAAPTSLQRRPAATSAPDRRHRRRGPHRARGRRAARGRRHRRARRLDAELGALRQPGRRLPRRGAAARRCPRSPSRPASRWAGRSGSTRSVSIDRFGASAPGAEVLERLGITPQATADAVRELLRAPPTVAAGPARGPARRAPAPARHRDVDRARLAHPGDQVERLEAVEQELERERLLARRGSRALDVERPSRSCAGSSRCVASLLLGGSAALVAAGRARCW